MPYDFIKERARVKQSCAALSITPTDRFLVISIEEQKMALIEKEEIFAVFTISTSKNPPSCLANSYGTPIGLHKIADNIGADAPEGSVFKDRVPTGQIYSQVSSEEAEHNLITSRILRLRGLEVGKNSGGSRDSYDRYIYIHGSNHEDRIGQPFSGGCVEMLNADVIELFDLVDEGDLIWIY